MCNAITLLGLSHKDNYLCGKSKYMAKSHTYQLTVTWTGNLGEGTKGYRAYSRDHMIQASGKPIILGSADPAFRGDAERYNPEEQLVAAVSTCHMLWYLHLCSDAKITVVSYQDDAWGEMEETANGGGRFKTVLLKPKILILEAEQMEKAYQLHEKAHQLCFIANSVNFPVRHEPSIELQFKEV